MRLEQSLRSGSPWFDEGQEFHSDGCPLGPLQSGHVIRGRHATSVFLARALSKFRVVCVRNWEAGGIAWSPFSLSAAELNIPREVCEVFSRQTQRGVTAGGLAEGVVCRSTPALSLSLSLVCTLHTLFNGPFLRQTNWTTTF